MKHIILTALTIAAVSMAVMAQTSEEIAAFRQSIMDNKETAKDAIGSFRYDGSKITYFNYKSYEQVKEVEVYLFNNSEYNFSINAEAVKKGLTIEVYDKAKGSNDRHKLKTIDGAAGKQTNFSSDDLNAAMKKAVPEAVRLKRVYLDFVIAKDSDEKSSNPMDSRGAIVLVMGYK